MPVFYLLIGIVVGFMSSTIGLGGSILAILILIAQIDQPEVGLGSFDKARVIIANTMVTLVSTNVAIALKTRVKLRISRDLLYTILIPGLITSALISWVIISFDILSDYLFVLLFFMMMLYTCKTIFTSRNEGYNVSCRVGGVEDRLRLMATGSFAGLIASLTACEPSPIIVPSLNRKCNFPIERSVSIYSTIFYFISIVISSMYFFSGPIGNIGFGGSNIGYILLEVAVPMSLGAFLSTFLGYELFRKTNIRYVAYLSTFLLALFSIRVFFMDIIYPLYK